MELLINCSGGIAGDMFTAALISAGADFNNIKKDMLLIAEKLGEASINKKLTADGSTQLVIDLKNNDFHLSGKKAGKLLEEVLNLLEIKEIYKDFAFRILQILIDAEKKAHRDNIFIEMNQNHHHGNNSHGDPDDTFLHEAQDIIIDIIGAVSGLNSLGIKPGAIITGPVRTGGGQVTFSHGTLDIPAPATRIILNDFNIEWEKGPVDFELCTPTGAAILAALKIDKNPPENIDKNKVKTGRARGSKILDILPLEISIPL